MDLPSLINASFKDETVFLRADLDVEINQEEAEVVDTTRLERLKKTIDSIASSDPTRIILIGHRGRPQGIDPTLSLSPLASYFSKNLMPTDFIEHVPRGIFFETFDRISLSKNKLVLLENIRFYEDEEKNSEEFAQELESFGNSYVNDAFATSHRNHASVDSLASRFAAKSRAFFGHNFMEEVDNLSKVFLGKRPIVVLISGAKEDKLEYLHKLIDFSDNVLVGGRLPKFISENDSLNPKVVVAQLNPDGEDITLKSMEKFIDVLSSAQTIFLSGPLGKYEDEGHRQGTETVMRAISNTQAFKVAGGGDTLAAINIFKISSSFDWISTGGGASIHFVANKTLPAIDAVIQKK